MQDIKRVDTWYETHCHIDYKEFDDGRDQLIKNLKDAGCAGVIVPGVTKRTWADLINLSLLNSGFIYPSLGLHPYFLNEHESKNIDLLDENLEKYSQIVAVGECGLDFYLQGLDRDLQIHYLYGHIELAKKHKLPLILHSRKSHDELAKILRRTNFHNRGVIHGFSGSLQQAKKFIDLGFVIGLGGVVTHERAKKMHKITKDLPLDAFVLETDAPDMRPAFALEKPNTPLNIPRIAQIIANLKDCSLEMIYKNTSNNTKAIFTRIKH